MIRLLARKICITIAICICSLHAISQTETFTTGSYIINMGATNPNTTGNGLKPYGMIYDLIRNYMCPIKWIVSSSKLKDGVDFTYNGVGYKGGTFIIPKEFRTPAINARISFWQSKGVVGVTTVSPLTIDVYRTLLSVPRWTLDKQSGKIAEQFLILAGINNTDFPNAYNWKDPSGLGPCDDFFVMPHADPTWATHGNLYDWNRSWLGTIWASCHAVSVLENMFNPANPSQRTNFLTTNGLISFKTHDKGSPPYINRLPNEPISQYLGPIDNATTNGSEEIYIPDPSKSSLWRPTTKLIAFDPTQKNVSNVAPDLSNAAAVLVYGRGFGNSSYGWVGYLAGHNQNKGTGDATAALRSFFDFSFYQVIEKAPILPLITSILANQTISGEDTLDLVVGNATSPVPGVTFSYRWISSCGGSFIPGTGIGQSVKWVAPTVAGPTNCVISCIVTDNCGRSSIQSIPVVITLPVRITGPQQTPSTFPDSVTIIPACGEPLSAISNVLDNDSDPNGRPMTLTGISTPSNGTVTYTSAGDITYTPAAGFYGVETLTYTVCNNESFCNTNTLKITVGDPAQLPSTTNDSYSIVEDHKSTFNVLSNDGSGLTVMSIPTMPKHGNVSINPDNTIDYLPNTDWYGTDSFYYKVTNTIGYTRIAKVNITVTTDGCTGGTYETVAVYDSTTYHLPVADAYLDKSNASKNFGNCGDLYLDGETAKVLRSVLKFDLTTPSYYGFTIPSNATINWANLKMIAHTVSSNTSYAVNAHRITNSWNQGTLCNVTNTLASNGVTWNNYNFSNAWTTVGGDYNATIDATTNVAGTGTYNWSITSMVQTWFANSANNKGVLLKFSNEGTGNQSKIFYSSEDATFANKPLLSVNFTVPHVCSAIPTRAPMAMPDTATTANGVAVNISTAANDYYPNAGTKFYTIIASPAHGSASINASSGVINYNPNTTYNGVDTLNYEVLNSTTGLRDTARVFVHITNGSVTATNDTPTADSSGVTQTIDVRSNDTDPEIAVLNNNYPVNIISDPKNGTASVDGNGNIVYTPFNGYTGKDTLYYSVTEPTPVCGDPLVDSAMVVITILNKQPVAHNDDTTSLPCASLTFSLINNDTDPENGVLTVTNVSAITPGGAGTVINNNDGTVTFTPATGFTGLVTFTYTITDNGVSPSTSAPATVSVNIQAGINNPPVAVDDYADTTYIDQWVFMNVLDNDDDPDNNSLSNPTVTVSPVHGIASVLPNGLIQYTPNPGFFGTDSLTYQTCDIVNNPSNCTQTPTLCTTAKMYLFVEPENETVAVNDENGTWTNTPVSGSVVFNDFDPNGDIQTFNGFQDGTSWTNTGSLVIGGWNAANTPVANAGTLQISSNGTYTFTPANNFTGVASVKYLISDNAGNPATDSAILRITVNAFPQVVNSLIANNDEYISYGNAISGNIFSNDRDPQADIFTGSSFKYDSDGNGSADASGTFGAPTAIGGMTTSGLALSNAGTITLQSNGTFTFTPVADFHGYLYLDYTICDNNGSQACATASIKIVVLPDINTSHNDPPVAGDDFNVTAINTPVTGNFVNNDYDPNNDPLSLNGTTINTGGAHTPVGSAVNTMGGGTVQFYSDGTYLYMPALGYVGPDSTGYTICDVTVNTPQPLCTPAYLHFIVSGFNTTLPIGDVNDTWTNVAVSGNISTNDQDPENDNLTVSSIENASSVFMAVNGGGTTVTISGKNKSGTPVANAGSVLIHQDGTYTFTPANNFAGIASTRYNLCDNGTPQVCTTVSLDITVNNVPQTNGSSGTTNITIANDDSKGTLANTAVAGNVLTNDKDPENNSMIFQSFLNQNGSGSNIATGSVLSGKDTSGNTVASAGTITFTSGGNYTFTPAAGFIGKVTVPYKMCDNGNPSACDEAQLIISVVPDINRSANKRPVGTDDLNIVNNFLSPGSSASGNVLTNDIDPGTVNAVNGTALTVQNPGTFATAHGSITIASDGSYTYTPVATYTGPDQYVYTVCDNGSPSLCTSATLYFLDIEQPVTLPINLFNFSGILVRDANMLNWAATNGNNTVRFEIENSTDNTGFRNIGSVAAKPAATQNNYSFIHSNPAPGINYYRLKIVDRDGHYIYSNVITLKRSLATFVNHVYPNPFYDVINGAIYADKAGYVTVSIYDAGGRKVKSDRIQVTKGYNLLNISGLDKLTPGVYMIDIKDGHSIVKSKLVKEDK